MKDLLRQPFSSGSKKYYSLFDVLVKNNQDLITSLVGKYPGDAETNLFTGMEKSTSEIKTALSNIKVQADPW